MEYVPFFLTKHKPSHRRVQVQTQHKKRQKQGLICNVIKTLQPPKTWTYLKLWVVYINIFQNVETTDFRCERNNGLWYGSDSEYRNLCTVDTKIRLLNKCNMALIPKFYSLLDNPDIDVWHSIWQSTQRYHRNEQPNGFQLNDNALKCRPDVDVTTTFHDVIDLKTDYDLKGQKAEREYE